MSFKFKIVRVNSDYCDYLRKFETKVCYNKFEKELRPFVGILFTIEKFEYFAPLSSPKKKHENMKMNCTPNVRQKSLTFGGVNFNNMIPVYNKNYILVDLEKETLTISEMKYQKMLKQQLNYLNKNYEQVKNKSYKLYTLYKKGKLPALLLNRCCNFSLLEEKCLEYDKI